MIKRTPTLLPKALLFFFTLLLWGLNTTSLLAQEDADDEWAPGIYMQQAVNNVFDKASLMSALSEFSWSSDLCLAGGILDVGNTLALEVELKEGEAYTFVGGGDEDVRDLDMFIVDRNENIIASDIEDDDTPIPDFVAPYSGRYSIRMQLISGDAPTSFVALSLLRKKGVALVEDQYLRTSDKFFAAGGSVHSVSSGVKWHDAKNQWCLFGVLLESKSDWTIENMFLDSADHYLFASAGESVDNVDLKLIDDNNKVIAEDLDDDAYPILETATVSSLRYTLKITNVKSSERSLILVGIVTE